MTGPTTPSTTRQINDEARQWVDVAILRAGQIEEQGFRLELADVALVAAAAANLALADQLQSFRDDLGEHVLDLRNTIAELRGA